MSLKNKFTTTLTEETIERLETMSIDKYKNSSKKNRIIEYLVNKEWERYHEVANKSGNNTK